MAVSSDITVAQDGGQGNVKLHPYLVTLLRWCISCFWRTAGVLLHRLMTTPLQPITGPKPPVPKPKVPKRKAGTEHLHPEPKVECQLLHQPDNHILDVIFVHGLYGSLGNTWRQGDWRLKYQEDPQKVPLRNHSSPNACNCQQISYKNHIYNDNKCDEITDLNDPEMTLTKINEKLSKKVIPEENDLITEQFYNNTLLDQVGIINSCDTQANFVSDLFKKENDCDNKNQNNRTNNDFKCDQSASDNDHKREYNEVNEFNECKCDKKKCEIGCGCVCSECYSNCWPKDWIKMDFPGARVISINYTSDPYLWRPLWIKENKRLNLYERAEQMIEQLLEMEVGTKPIIWVGHSKGGLFIKQIYCEAYEAFTKKNKKFSSKDEIKDRLKVKKMEEVSNETHNGITAENIDTIVEHFSHCNQDSKQLLENDKTIKNADSYTINSFNYTRNCGNHTRNGDNYTGNGNLTKNSDKYTENNYYISNNDKYMRYNDNIANNNICVMSETIPYENIFEQIETKNESANVNFKINDDDLCDLKEKNCNSKCVNALEIDLENGDGGNDITTSSIEEASTLFRRSLLWSSSKGFMFYSVPHRGSPLADIKTPVTARSVDLLEIAKDCPLVLDLQSRWLLACGGATHARVVVRSFVETCRTLMSVLWLRIVSTDSADAGIGSLSGISVDHREICKPSSRNCLLYTELTDLIHEALKCRCQ